MPAPVPRQKRYPILPWEKPVLWAFGNVTQPWPPSIIYGHLPDHHITLRSA
jgi:hypothetical protein